MNQANNVWVTPEGRTSFLNVYEARPNKFRQGALYYDFTLIFPKTAALNNFVKMAQELSLEAFSNSIPPRSIFPGDQRSGSNEKPVFKDGDALAAQKEAYASYAGHWVLTLSCPQKDRILVQDEDRQEVLDAAVFQSGDYAKAAVEVSVYRSQIHGPQLSVKPKVLRKTRQGARFGGSISVDKAAEYMDAETQDAPENPYNGKLTL